MAIIKETKVRTFTVNGITITIAARNENGEDAFEDVLVRVANAFWQSGDDAEHNGYLHTAKAERSVASAIHDVRMVVEEYKEAKTKSASLYGKSVSEG